VATAHPEPRGYVTHQIFQALREAARDNGGLEIFFHAGLDESWPPKEFTHDNAIWSTEGKFMPIFRESRAPTWCLVILSPPHLKQYLRDRMGMRIGTE